MYTALKVEEEYEAVDRMTVWDRIGMWASALKAGLICC